MSKFYKVAIQYVAPAPKAQVEVALKLIKQQNLDPNTMDMEDWDNLAFEVAKIEYMGVQSASGLQLKNSILNTKKDKTYSAKELAELYLQSSPYSDIEWDESSSEEKNLLVKKHLEDFFKQFPEAKNNLDFIRSLEDANLHREVKLLKRVKGSVLKFYRVANIQKEQNQKIVDLINKLNNDYIALGGESIWDGPSYYVEENGTVTFDGEVQDQETLKRVVKALELAIKEAKKGNLDAHPWDLLERGIV